MHDCKPEEMAHSFAFENTYLFDDATTTTTMFFMMVYLPLFYF